VKSKPWVAAAAGIVEYGPPPGEHDDAQDEMEEEDPYGSEAEEQDPYGQQEEDPFGFNEGDTAQVGGSSSSAGNTAPTIMITSSGSDPPPEPPPTPTTTTTDSPSTEPAAKRACDGVGVTTDVLAVTDLAVAGSVVVDPWAALQERKRRKRNDGRQPVVESEFARLARLAANEK